MPAAGVQGRTAAVRFAREVTPLPGTPTHGLQTVSFIYFQEFLRIFGSGQLETEPQTRQNVGPAAELLAGLRFPEISWSSPGLSNRNLTNIEDFQVKCDRQPSERGRLRPTANDAYSPRCSCFLPSPDRPLTVAGLEVRARQGRCSAFCPAH